MKIHTLTMSAFGPFAGIETIDFTRCNQAGLFRLAGATGAGKSTILDAIMFALYGETTGQGQGRGEVDGREAGDLRCSACAPEAETAVTLEFETQSARYRVRRSPAYQRPAQRGGGVVREAASASVEQLVAGVWTPRTDLRRIPDISRFLEQELGLSAEQFRRVIVIPQGRFREVLISTADAREQLLKKIFGTHVYERFESMVNRRAREGAAVRQRLATERETILRGGEWSSPDDLAAVRTEAVGRRDAEHEAWSAADRRYRECDIEVTKATDAQRQAMTAHRLLDNLDRAEAAASEAQTACESLRALAHELAEAKRVADAARAIEVAESTALQEQAASAEVERRSTEVASLLIPLEAATSERNRAADDATVHGAMLREESGRIQAELPALEELVQRIAADRARQADIGKRLAKADQKCAAAEGELEDAIAAEESAEHALERGRGTQHANRAGLLAQDLMPGCACPVCGSLEHPFPAAVTGEVMDDSRIEELEEEVRQARTAREQAERTVSQARLDAERLRTESGILGERLEAIKDDPAERVSKLASRKDEIRKRELQLADTLQRAVEAERSASKAHAQAVELRERAKGQCLSGAAAAKSAAELEKLELERIGESDRERVRSATRTAAWIADADRRIAEANRSLSDASGAVRAAREVAIGAVRRDTVPLDAEVVAWTGRRDEARRDAEAAGTRRDLLTALVAQIDDLSARLESAERELKPAFELEQLVGGGAAAGRVSLHAWVLGAFLDEVLAVASQRMHELTRGRYELHRMSEAEDLRQRAGLGIEVFDTHVGSRRPARTLSGGETFLASLSMALALGEVAGARGGRALDTVFIDEGFGTLDSESLELAMDVLARLRESGRTIGLISHVDELRRRIPTGIEVVKDQGTGISRIRVDAADLG